MDGGASVAGEGYVPPPKYVEDTTGPLTDLVVSDSTELWLIQWPTKMPPDLDGQELTLKLHRDGKLGTFEDASGKEYEVLSYASQEPNATVFMPSSSGPRFAGNISRRVSLVTYPDPNELEKLTSNYSNRTSVAAASSQFSSRTPSSKMRSSSRGHMASTRSSRQKSGISSVGEPSKNYKRRHPHESTYSLGLENSTQDSGQGHSGATTAELSDFFQDHGTAASSRSVEHSDSKTKKKKKD